MDDAFIGGEPHGSERIETGVQDSRRRAPPAGMQRGDRPAWVGHEHGGAIGDRDGQRRARRLGDVAVDATKAQPSTPPAVMPFYGRPVYLVGCRQSFNPQRSESVL